MQFLIFDKTFLSHINSMMLDINKQTAENMRSQIDRNFSRIYSTLNRIAENDDIRDSKYELDKINNFIQDVDILMVVNENGDILNISGNKDVLSVFNLKDRTFFKQAMQKKSHISNVHTSSTGRKFIRISVPIIRNNQAVGAVAGIIRLTDDNLASPFENGIFGNYGTAIVMDSHGAIIYGPDKNRIGQQAETFGDMTGESGSLLTNNMFGENYFIGYSKIADIGGHVVVKTPVSDIIKSKNTVMYEMLGFFVIETTVFIALALYIIRRYAKSTEQLLSAFGNLKKGSYKRLNTSDYKKEFRKIVEVYNDALKTARAEYDNLTEAANLDQLTQAYNRRAFDRVLKIVDDEMQSGIIKNVGFLLLDLDHFKGLNDRAGHLSGDKILQKAVAIMKEFAGERSVFRFGGDEFAILKRDIDKNDLLNMAENIRINAQSMLDGCTLSIGVANYPDDASTIFTLLDKADKALYISKIDRNKVTAFWHK
ncbi:diguanylate cyclase [Pectinatus haikarae]|uniref:Diguanylate cyclase (GGDEF)-like protein n=1 Tax=Pectinatus haikarae TaxID=349096 RepID=A0ABT9YAS8_9FIRM|nr:diguanylate cyclase [Pectinatus haikarae]MDQ0204917.1 diguanylate cyclase (GGDEF)-like protein [Pectinatus haikarae]